MALLRARHVTPGAVTSATLLVVGVSFGYQSFREGVGSLNSTGAGFFPLLVSIVLVGSSAAVLVQDWRARHSPETHDTDARDVTPNETHRPAVTQAATPAGPEDAATDWKRVVAVLLAALATPLLAETLGFVVSLSIAVVLIAKVMGMPGRLMPLLLGAGFGTAAWYVFVYWLFVPLPAGVLGLG